MLFRTYFLAAKLALLGGVSLGLAAGAERFGNDRVVAGFALAAVACFVPYVGLGVLLRFRRPAMACPLCGTQVAWNAAVLRHQLDCPNCGRVSGRPLHDWRLRAEPVEQEDAAAVPDAWRPNAVSVFISPDLVPEMLFRQEEILRKIGEVRAKHGIETRVRIRDHQLLAGRSYEVAINGVGVAGYTLSSRDNLESHLAAALEYVCDRYGDAVRYFGAQEAAVT